MTVSSVLDAPNVTSAGSAGAKSPDDLTGFSSDRYDAQIIAAAHKYQVPPRLVKAVIQQESTFNASAESKCGAGGLMQLMPATAKELGVSNVDDPGQNIEGGTKFLASLLHRYNGNVQLALAAYNAGPGNVNKYGGVPPFAETQHYVSTISGTFAGTGKIATPSLAALSQGGSVKPGSPFGILPDFFDKLIFLYKADPNDSLDDVAEKVEKQDREMGVEPPPRAEILAKLQELNPDQVVGGQIAPGAVLRLPVPGFRGESDRFGQPAPKRLELAPDATVATASPETNPELAKTLPRVVQG